MVAACAIAAAGPASAGHKAAFRLNLRSGDVVEAANVEAPSPVEPWPAPHDPRRSITSEEQTISVFEGDPGDPAARKVVWQLTLPGSGAEWFPWQVLQGNTVTYARREEVPGQKYRQRDVTRAVDMDSQKVLWERVDPVLDSPGAAGLGADHLVINQEKEVVVLETIERLVQGRVDDGDLSVGLLVDEHGYAVSVHRTPGERLEHEEVERALEQFQPTVRHRTPSPTELG